MNIKNNPLIQLVSLCPKCEWSIHPIPNSEMKYAFEIPGHTIIATHNEILEFIGWLPFRDQTHFSRE